VKGGFDVPEYLGSRSTFTLGQFGGHVGRALRKGDVLRLTQSTPTLEGCVRLASAEIPTYGKHWNIAVTYGPHGAPDFFTEEDIDTFFSTDWEVHYNSSRTGVRSLAPSRMGANRRRGSRTAPLEHSRQRLRHRAIDLHRGYASHNSVLTGPVSGASCARRSSLAPTSGRWGSCGLVIRSGFRGFPRMHPRCCSGSRMRAGIAVSYRHSGEDYRFVEYGAPFSTSSCVSRACSHGVAHPAQRAGHHRSDSRHPLPADPL